MKPAEFAEVLIKTIEHGNRVWLFGNGGCFAIATHFAEDLGGNCKSSGLLWPISVLGSQQALFTANCNDNAFKEGIAIEIRTFGQVGDLFLALSTSGKSQNIVEALRESIRRGLNTYLLTSKKYINIFNNDISIITVGEENDDAADIELKFAKYLTMVVKHIFSIYYTSEGKRKAIFIDRDGTLVPETVNGRQLFPEKLLPGIPNMLRELKRRGFLLILVSNQSIVGRNKISIEEHWSIHKRLEQALHAEGIRLNDYYYCFYDKTEKCACRKPEAGLLLKAAKDWNIDLKSSYVIGNSESDIEAGRSVGCGYFLLEYDRIKKDWIVDRSPYKIIEYFNSNMVI